MIRKTIIILGLALVGCSGTAETNVNVPQPDLGSTPLDMLADAGTSDLGPADVRLDADEATDLALDLEVPRDSAADQAEPADASSDDAGSQPDAAVDMFDGPPPGVDDDGDGLDDRWEFEAGDTSYLDWRLADTDQNGVDDGDEDYDGDGLSNLEEFQIGQRASANAVRPPHPLELDILVELDEMQQKTLSPAALSLITDAFAGAPIDNPNGQRGIGVHIFRDQTGLATFDFDGSFTQRHNFLMAHPPTYSTQPVALPVDKMVHVMVVTRRADQQFRGAEVVTDGAGDPEKTGILIYYDALDALHPQCGIASANIPAITLDEALAGAFVHEMGHILQLGHEDSTGGSVNTFNVMYIPTTCTEARQRFKGEGNLDSSLGAVETSPHSSFSVDAVNLMRFDQMLSVHTSTLLDGDNGFEM